MFRALIKIFIAILTIAMITFFEISYRTEKFKYAVTGIELLVLNSVIMYLPYIYYHIENQIIVSLVMLVSVYFGIYYSIKCLIIYKKEDKKHKDSLSDIREIMKNNNESYLEEESQKIIKEKNKIKNIIIEPETKKKTKPKSKTKSNEEVKVKKESKSKTTTKSVKKKTTQN